MSGLKNTDNSIHKGKFQFAGMLTKDMETEKHGNHWTAYYAPESGRYFAGIMYISREGLEEYRYEITHDIFSQLGTFADDTENERLIKTAEMVYSFENTMYGTLGPEKTVFNDDANEAMKETVARKHKKPGF
ncbi:MAG: hypothetical protein IJ201_10395 [Solobacterium sp.]|nr:hypothetical protein [Solobacterium sp.]